MGTQYLLKSKNQLVTNPTYTKQFLSATIKIIQSLFSEVIIMLYIPKPEGQGLVEYMLILMMIALVVIIILAALAPTVGNMYSNIVQNFPK